MKSSTKFSSGYKSVNVRPDAYGKISFFGLLSCLAAAVLCVGCAMLYALNTNSSMRLMQVKLTAMSHWTARFENRYRRHSNDLPLKKEEELADNFPHRLSRRSPSSDDVQLSTTGTGVPYVRWGRRDCSGPSNELVYNGYAAGAYHTHTGGSSQYLCLHNNVTYSPGRYQEGFQGVSRFYGVEYRDSAWVSSILDLSLTEGASLSLHSVPCAICLARQRSNQLMIPGRDTCPDGWTKEYSGYMMGNAYSAKHTTFPICVDDKPQVVPGTEGEQHGEYLYMVETDCHSLPCEPYIAGRELVCVVCTL